MPHIKNPHDLLGGTNSGDVALSILGGPLRSGFEVLCHVLCPEGSLMDPKGAQGIRKAKSEPFFLPHVSKKSLSCKSEPILLATSLWKTKENNNEINVFTNVIERLKKHESKQHLKEN